MAGYEADHWGSAQRGEGYSPTRGLDGNWSSNAPVFCIDFESEGLPVIWITERRNEPTLERTGRNCWHRYPGALVGEVDEEESLKDGAIPDAEPAVCDGGSSEDTATDGDLESAQEVFDRFCASWEKEESCRDEEGWQALSYGGGYYREAMSIRDPRFKQDRIDCFRAAEVLYLWAANKGNIQGYVNLGYVYGYDRCEGDYLGMDETGTWICDPIGLPDEVAGERRPALPVEFPRERRAYECFSKAAKSGHPEACYKLGDLLSRGIGCEPDPVRAVELWEHAFDRARACGEPTWWGAAALRLGAANEDGEGCDQDFSKALTWYTHAEKGLRVAVESGDWFYEKSLARARAGKARCEQELSMGRESPC